PLINVLDAYGRVNETVPEAYRGLDRFEARQRIVADMAAAGLLARIEPTAHMVPHGDRSGVPIEPWLTDQWYVKADVLAKTAMKAVRSGKTRFVPERFAGDYFRWLEEIEPWCISRQLWWGHQIPAWYAAGGEVFVAESEAEAAAQAKAHFGRPTELTRDPDVLDTWFSSALWPFSTLGWPDETPELARFYPTTALVTGFDIIFFWVARMMMMGLEFMGRVPFKDVYIHGLVRDERGQKMSKSKGNVVDPLVMIDEFGADALRFSMAAMASQGADVKFSKSRIEGYRNFATKLWNAARFAEMNGCALKKGFDPRKAKEPANRWIAGEAERTAAAVTAAIEGYRFNEAAAAVYAFVWGTYCDWYLEIVKPVLSGPDGAQKTETQSMLAWARDQILKLLHPFMPYITEELWRVTGEAAAATGGGRETMLVVADWPKLKGLADAEADAEMAFVLQLVNEIRSVRSEMGVPAAAQLRLDLVGAGEETKARALRHGEVVKRMARLEAIGFADAAPKGSVQIVIGEALATLPLAGVIDLDKEAKRLAREVETTDAEIRKVEAKLGNADFMAKAPEHIVEENRDRLATFTARRRQLDAALGRLKGLG
ncbi:MAG: valine--tRNA ligase, partial [Hyphomicrobiaceae bacterium]